MPRLSSEHPTKNDGLVSDSGATFLVACHCHLRMTKSSDWDNPEDQPFTTTNSKPPITHFEDQLAFDNLAALLEYTIEVENKVSSLIMATQYPEKKCGSFNLQLVTQPRPLAIQTCLGLTRIPQQVFSAPPAQ